jgi:hypothetical protein
LKHAKEKYIKAQGDLREEITKCEKERTEETITM